MAVFWFLQILLFIDISSLFCHILFAFSSGYPFGKEQDYFQHQRWKAGISITELHVGDSVVVKFGVLDPDFEIDISGWQGRIEEVYDKETVFIRWDSITLHEMRLDMIIRCENENLDWEVMTLNRDEIEVTTARDSEADVLRIAFQLNVEMIGDLRLNSE